MIINRQPKLAVNYFIELLDKEKYGCYYNQNCNGLEVHKISGEHAK